MDDFTNIEGISDAHDVHYSRTPQCYAIGPTGHLTRAIALYTEATVMPSRVFIGHIEELHEAQLEALIEGKEI